MKKHSLKLEMLIEQYKDFHEKHTDLKNEKNKIIEEEIKTFLEIFKLLKPYYPYEIINGVKSYLIYRFENSKNTSISPKVYYCDDGYVRYAVFDVETYKCYNPEVIIEERAPFAKVSLQKMFETLELYDFLHFILDRLSTLNEIHEKKMKELFGRKSSLEDFKDLLQKYRDDNKTTYLRHID